MLRINDIDPQAWLADGALPSTQCFRTIVREPMTRLALSITFMLSLVASALAQTPKPITIECTTDHKTVSVTETNPNAAEALCEYTCYYTAADKKQHHTNTKAVPDHIEA